MCERLITGRHWKRNSGTSVLLVSSIKDVDFTYYMFDDGEVRRKDWTDGCVNGRSQSKF